MFNSNIPMKIMGSIDFRPPVFDIETETSAPMNRHFQVPYMGIAIPRTNRRNPSSQYSVGHIYTCRHIERVP
jgi:hypothetical protein